jgi:hypothetical protein
MGGMFMETTEKASCPRSRKKIAIRFLFTIFFVILLEILKITLQLTVLFQYVHLFITTDYNDPVRRFSNKLIVYAYRIMRYITLTENARPFPFSDFPAELDEPEAEASFE